MWRHGGSQGKKDSINTKELGRLRQVGKKLQVGYTNIGEPDVVTSTRRSHRESRMERQGASEEGNEGDGLRKKVMMVGESEN